MDISGVNFWYVVGKEAQGISITIKFDGIFVLVFSYHLCHICLFFPVPVFFTFLFYFGTVAFWFIKKMSQGLQMGNVLSDKKAAELVHKRKIKVPHFYGFD